MLRFSLFLDDKELTDILRKLDIPFDQHYYFHSIASALKNYADDVELIITPRSSCPSVFYAGECIYQCIKEIDHPGRHLTHQNDPYLEIRWDQEKA